MTADTDDVGELKAKLREMPFEFLPGVPVNLSYEMVDRLAALIHEREVRAKIKSLKEIKIYRPYKIGGGYQVLTFKNEVREFVDTFDIDGEILRLEAALHAPNDGKEK